MSKLNGFRHFGRGSNANSSQGSFWRGSIFGTLRGVETLPTLPRFTCQEGDLLSGLPQRSDVFRCDHDLIHPVCLIPGGSGMKVGSHEEESEQHVGMIRVAKRKLGNVADEFPVHPEP